jgi:hypothetical protein
MAAHAENLPLGGNLSRRHTFKNMSATEKEKEDVITNLGHVRHALNMLYKTQIILDKCSNHFEHEMLIEMARDERDSVEVIRLRLKEVEKFLETLKTTQNE